MSVNDWVDHTTEERAWRLENRGEADIMLARLSKQVVRESAAFDAGFEYGVLAQEAGLGRYND